MRKSEYLAFGGYDAVSNNRWGGGGGGGNAASSMQRRKDENMGFQAWMLVYGLLNSNVQTTFLRLKLTADGSRW